jgi:hypothetical protein
MNRPQIKYYCDLFAPHMTFKSKSQRYEFNKKMTQNWAKQDAAEPGRDNLSYELFKLCIHLQRELDSRPAQAVTETEPETIPEVLDAYARQIDSIPTRFTHPSMMEECHELVWRMAEHLEKIEETSDGADEERASELCYELTTAGGGAGARCAPRSPFSASILASVGTCQPLSVHMYVVSRPERAGSY